MENISTNDFDKLESLLKNKNFEELTLNEKQWVLTFMDEAGYYSMALLYHGLGKNTDNKTEIEPSPEIKNKLDFVLKKSKRGSVIGTLNRFKIPVYQSVAVALIFFMIGFFANIYKSKPIIVSNRVEVIKYVTKPAENNSLHPEIKSGNIARKSIKKKLHGNNSHEPQIANDLVINTAVNPDITNQQEIAMTNVNKVLTETNGNSMGSDSILKKMLVTVY
jgi:hypothetical protein